MRRNKIHGFILADQDWIGLMIFKNLRIRAGSDSTFADQDWTRTEKFHSPLISAVLTERHGVMPWGGALKIPPTKRDVGETETSRPRP